MARRAGDTNVGSAAPVTWAMLIPVHRSQRASNRGHKAALKPVNEETVVPVPIVPLHGDTNEDSRSNAVPELVTDVAGLNKYPVAGSGSDSGLRVGG